MRRRNFLKALGFSAMATSLPMAFSRENGAGQLPEKKIEGSWFEFQHHNLDEGVTWNPQLARFTAEQWDDKVREIAEAGLRYLVLLNVAIYDKTFYPSRLLPQHELGTPDPLETVLTAADKYGIKFFVSNDFFGNWRDTMEMISDPKVLALRKKAVEEIAEKYAHHDSFYGWYYPNETGIHGHYDDIFIKYVNDCSAEVAAVTPNLKRLIAPYGTRDVEADDLFVKQLDELDVDFIAYQDEIGVQKTQVEESAAFFEKLHKMHKKSGRSELWADVEFFEFTGRVYHSELVSAPSERVIQQLEAVAPFVEKILIYQYIGLVNHPESQSFTGRPQSSRLYRDLADSGWLRK